MTAYNPLEEDIPLASQTQCHSNKQANKEQQNKAPTASQSVPSSINTESHLQPGTHSFQ